MEEQNQNFLNELIGCALEKIKELSSSNTIVGESVKTLDGTTIIPISKVSVGYVVGGGEYSNFQNKKKRFPSAGGTGGGVSIVPIGFIIETKGEVKFIDVENKTAYQTIINMLNSVFTSINLKNKEKMNEKD